VYKRQGEIGLGGELRPVIHMESRLREAVRMGFTRAVVPSSNLDKIAASKGIRTIGISQVRDALELFS
jgi:DNA repair protein RadA/Sms